MTRPRSTQGATLDAVAAPPAAPDRTLRSAGVADGQLVEVKFHGFGKWTGLVLGAVPEDDCRRYQGMRLDCVRVSWGPAGGEHERGADCGYVLHLFREGLCRRLKATHPDLERPSHEVDLVSGPPTGCRFLAPSSEIDEADFDRLCAFPVSHERFDATLARPLEPATDDELEPSVPSYPLPLLYIAMLELACEDPEFYRPRFVSLGGAMLSNHLANVSRLVIETHTPLRAPQFMLAAIADALMIKRLHLKRDGGVGFRQAFRMLEALVLLLCSTQARG